MKSTKWLDTLVGVCVLFILTLNAFNGTAQSVTLQDCYLAADKNYPLIKKAGLLSSQTRQTDLKLAKGYFPQLQAAAQATYQNEVTAFSGAGAFSGIPTLEKDQYRVGVSFNQPLFDGGEITALRKSNTSYGQALLQQNSVDLYAVKERVSGLFFEAMLLDENRQIIQTTLNELNARLKARRGAFKYGTAQASEVNALEAEVLQVGQQLSSLHEDRRATVENLAILTGLDFSPDAKFSLPQKETPPAAFVQQRPEYSLFDLQKRNLNDQLKVVNSRLLPKLSLFGEGNYGRPGFNFLRNDFGEFWLVGVKVSWNLSSLYTRQEEKTLNNLQQQEVDVQREVFRLNQSADYSRRQSTIRKLDTLLKQDDVIIRLKAKVRIASAAKLDNGTATATDYISDVQSEQQAQYSKALHRIQRLQAIEQLNLINGTDK